MFMGSSWILVSLFCCMFDATAVDILSVCIPCLPYPLTEVNSRKAVLHESLTRSVSAPAGCGDLLCCEHVYTNLQVCLLCVCVVCCVFVEQSRNDHQSI